MSALRGSVSPAVFAYSAVVVARENDAKAKRESEAVARELSYLLHDVRVLRVRVAVTLSDVNSILARATR